jgi:AAA+ superfamily predicted ATPase
MTADRQAGLEPAAWMRRALAVLALRLRHEVALVRALRGPGRQENFLGLFVSDDEAEAILAEASGRLRASGTAAAAAELAALEDGLAAARRADPAGVWVRLAERLGLGEAELDLLLLAAAPALDPRIGRVYGYLNDDLARRYLTPALAVRLLDRHAVDVAGARRMLAADAPLRRTGMVVMGAERPAAEAPLRTPEEVLDRLLGEEGLPAELARHCELLPVRGAGAAAPPGTWLLGAPGGPPEEAALALAAGLGLDVLIIEGDGLEAAGRSGIELVAACVREARLAGAMPVLRGLDAAGAAERRAVAAVLRPPAAVLTRTPEVWADAGILPAAAPPDPCRREDRIGALLDGHAADSAELRAWLGRLERLDLLALSRLLVRHRDPASLRAAVRARVSRGLTGLAHLVTADHRLDDVVVPARTRTALRTLIAWQDTKTTVRDRWGLGGVFGKSPSTVALFKGPSGTGKTMAASAVAGALDLPLFRVNLAGLVSKYIGETEKNLDLLFDAAEAADVVLFFDEADAVFGRRSEVHDAHDRYANLETAYLLQRLEAYGGIAILASNLHQNIDDAFVRRFDLVVDFPAPDRGARRAIWERLRAGTAPIGADVDLDVLAGRFELTGGEIRNCCLAAAHAAAAEGRPIGMDALIRAIGRELAKSGRPVRRAAFGEHYAALREAGA